MAERERPIEVVLIDDDEDVRSLVETMISVDDRFHLAGSTGSAVDGIDLATRQQPDAVVVDLHLPGMDGLQAIPLLHGACDAVVIVFSAFPDPYTLLAALERGADGYVDKARTWAELLPAIATACDCRDGAEP